MRYRDLISESNESQRILDMLTPLAAQGIDYVTIDQIIQKFKTSPSGMLVDREMIMSLLDPNKFPLIKSIEGDKLFLTTRVGPTRSVNDKQADKEQEQIKTSATNQAIKSVTKS